ncbi:MAG: S8 family serine peptidase [Pseudomonadota bacterium]|uniref:S8 family serine peptidase n=1 Tax=Phenylobacterium sp. TaxID=1871053 RepID=UPI0025FB146B|nr:S8 family serine peptidase [Phenylobacterium sp.]MBT9472252.1 S8 family serine peptidase [Phenylobacterium sp.]
MVRHRTPARRRSCAWKTAVLLLALAVPPSAQAQLVPGLDLPTTSLPGLPSGAIQGRLPPPLSLPDAPGLANRVLQQARAVRLTALIRDNPAIIDVDDRGAPVVKGEVLAVSPSPEALVRLETGGFRVRSRTAFEGLGLDLVVLAIPAGLSAREAVRRVRAIDPEGEYDFNHIYSAAGAAEATGAPASGDGGAAARVGLIDGGVDTRHPALRNVRIEQRGFAPGGVQPRAHGLAVASLLAGSQGRFQGSAPGASLYVADVYGSTPAGGSAAALAAALGWMAQSKVGVINVSLVGPPNLTLQAAVRAMVARGHLIVAAVGNDGPAAPPLYPAAYPGVIAVTAVDSRRRLLPEAGRPPRIDFAAPGADMAAPGADGGFVAVRGTSFAAPIVAGRLARNLPTPDPASAARATALLARDAQDLGAKGPDARFGKGLVGFELATRPATVAARGVLTHP